MFVHCSKVVNNFASFAFISLGVLLKCYFFSGQNICILMHNITPTVLIFYGINFMIQFVNILAPLIVLKNRLDKKKSGEERFERRGRRGSILYRKQLQGDVNSGTPHQTLYYVGDTIYALLE
jgi:hypothetical protein